MNTALQQMIESKNRQTAGARKRQFATRSSDQQMLDHLAKNARCVLDSYQAAGAFISKNLDEAMKELKTAVCMAEKRLKP